MTTTSILALPLLASNQSQKEVTINDALSALERAISDRLVVPLTADVTIALGDSTRYAIFVTSGNTSAHTLTFPASKRFFFVKNGGTAPVDVAVAGVAQTFTVPVNATGFYYADATSFTKLLDTTQSGGTPASFLLLADTPDSYAGKAGKALVVTATEDGLGFSAIATDFLSMADTPDSFAGAQGKFVKVNGSASGLEFVNGVSSFVTLSDVPSSYAGNGTKLLAVKGTENGLEFIEVPSLSAERTVNAYLTVFDDTVGWAPVSGNWSIQPTFGSVAASSYNDTFLVCNSPDTTAGVINQIERTIDLTSVVTAAELDTGCDLKISILESSSYNDYGSAVATFYSGTGTVLSTVSTGNFTAYPDPSWTSRTLSAPIPVGARSVKITLGATNIEDSTAVTHAYARVRVDVLVPVDTISTFLDLQDVPHTYVASNRVRVNAAGNGLEFVPDTLASLKDIPDISGKAGKVLKIKPDLSGYEWGDASTVGAIGDLSDVPDSRTGNAKKVLRVKADESGLEYVNASVYVGTSSSTAEATTIEFSNEFVVTVGVGGIATVTLSSAASGGTLKIKEGVGGTELVTETLVFDPASFAVTDLGSNVSQVGPKEATATTIYQSTQDGNLVSAQFAAYSFGAPTVTKNADGSLSISGTNASSAHAHGIGRAAPATDFSVMARVSSENGVDSAGYGLALIESSGTLTTLALYTQSGIQHVISQVWTNATTTTSNVFDIVVAPGISWLKMAYVVATNALTFSTSANGTDWQIRGTATLDTDPQWVALCTSGASGTPAAMRAHYYSDSTYTSDPIQAGGGNIVGKRRYWRFQFNETQNGGAAALSALVLHSTVGGALQAPVASSQSSIAATGNEATRLYDGDAATAWIAGATGQQWVDFDFGVNGVECVEVVATSMNNSNFNQAPLSAEVLISDDGKFFQHVGKLVFGSWVQNETKTATLPSRLVASSYATDDVDTAANLAKKKTLLDNAILTGTTGQVLTKRSAAAGDVEWRNPAAVGGGSGSGIDSGAHAYWRIRITEGFSTGWYTFYELVFANTPFGSTLTTGGTPIAGGDGYNDPSNAFDNSTATRWAKTPANDGTDWIGYHFTNPVTVSEIRLQASYVIGEMIKSWVVEYSDDGALWTALNSYTDPTSWGVGEWRTYGVPAIGTSIDALADVNISADTPVDGNVLAWNGKAFVPASVLGGVVKSTRHRWWRLKFLVGWTSDGWVTLGDMGFASSVGGASIVSGGYAFCGVGGDCSNAFDGNADSSHLFGIQTSYIATGQNWVGYCFPTEVDVRSVILTSSAWPAEMPKTFALEFSDDGCAWQPAQTYTDSTAWTAQDETRHYAVTAFDPTWGLNSLPDVEVTSPTVGQALVFKSDNTWGAGDIPQSISDLSDVDMSSQITGGQTLVWDAVQHKFKPGTVTGGSSGSGGGSAGSYRGTWGVNTELANILFDTQTLPATWTYYNQNNSAADFILDADSTAANTYAFQFGDINDAQETWVQFTVVSNDLNNTLSFRWKGESETGFDKLRVYLDGIETAVWGGYAAGAGIWTSYSLVIPTGTHTIKLRYSKDGSGTNGFDNFRFSKLSYPVASTDGYHVGDTVLHDGIYWYCTTEGATVSPGTGTAWLPFLPAGGFSGQVVTKDSTNPFDVSWESVSGGSGGSSTSAGGGGNPFSPVVSVPKDADLPVWLSTSGVTDVSQAKGNSLVVAGSKALWNASGDGFARLTPLTGTTFEVVAQFLPLNTASSYDFQGIFLRDAVTNKTVIFGFSDWNTTTTLTCFRATLDGFAQTSDTTLMSGFERAPLWAKVACTAGAVSYYVSTDGVVWLRVGGEALTVGIPNLSHVGIGYASRMSHLTDDNAPIRGFPIQYFHARATVGGALSGTSNAVLNANGEMPFTPPTVASFPVFRSGSSGSGAVEDMSNSRGIRLKAQKASGNNNSLTYVADVTAGGATGKWTAVGRFRRHGGFANWGMAGMLIRDAASGKTRTMWIGRDASTGFNINTFSADDTWDGITGVVEYYENEWWQKAEFDGTNINWYVSKDGDFWVLLRSDSAATYLPVAPTHVGIGINPNYAGTNAGQFDAVDVLSWSMTRS